MIASWVVAWLVPVILALLVLAGAWVGVRWYSAEHVPSLERVPLFRSLTPHQIRAIARSVARQEYSPGTRIVTEGELEDGFFLLDEGSATVIAGGEKKATLGPGAYFGEMAVIDRGPRSATIVAETPVSALHLPSSALSRLIASDPSIADAIAAEIAKRLRSAGVQVSEPPSSIGRDGLIALCHQLRSVQHADWGTDREARRRSRFRLVR